jgi:hypothetical protein
MAWKAMKSVPKRMPSVPARIVHPMDNPIPGPMNPMVMVKNWKLPRNQNGPWCQTFPWRSSSGT